MEFGEAFLFKTPSSILVVGLSDYARLVITESLLLDHLEELFVNPLSTIHYCYGAWQNEFRDMKDTGVQFHRRDSGVRPSQFVVYEGWITGIRQPGGRGR